MALKVLRRDVEVELGFRQIWFRRIGISKVLRLPDLCSSSNFDSKEFNNE
jgi:hypothetical protein